MRTFETSENWTAVSSWHYCFVFRRGRDRIRVSRLAYLTEDFVIFFSPYNQRLPPSALACHSLYPLSYWRLHDRNSKIWIYYRTWLHRILWECPFACFYAYGFKPSPVPKINFGSVKNASVCRGPPPVEPLSNIGAPKAKLKANNCRPDDMKGVTWFSVSLYQPLNSTDHQ